MALNTTGFKLLDPLLLLEQGSIGGNAPAIGSVTGGSGGSIANNTITSANIVPGTITGGPGGNIAPNTITASDLAPGAVAANIGNAGNTQFGVIEFDPSGDLTQTAPNSGIALLKSGAVTGGPTGNIAANTITATELAPGAIATNINSSPPGSINASQIENAGNTQFGVVEFDPSGDLTQTTTNSGIAMLKTGAVTNSKIAAGAVTGGPGGSIAPNTVTAGELAPGAAATNIGNAGNTQFGVVEFATTGDLTQTANNSGIAVVKNNAITYPKIQNTTQSALLGSSIAGPVSEITTSPVFSLAGNTLSLTPTFNYNTGRQVNVPFTLSRNAYVSYVYEITGVVGSIEGVLSINSPVNTDISRFNLTLPITATLFTYHFTLSGFVPAGTQIEITVIKDGANLVGQTPDFSTEVLF